MSPSQSPYGRRYPGHVSEFDDLEKLLDEQLFQEFAPAVPPLGPDARVVTLGSCFAMNIADSLSQLGMRVMTHRFHEEANSPLANLLLLDYLLNKEESSARSLFEEHIPLSKTDDLLQPIREADCLIFTVGVGLTCFHKKTGELVLHPNEEAIEDIDWSFPSPEVSARHLGAIVQTIQELSPGIHTVLTLSPVPLYRAVTTGSAFVEDCISKSHLRVALHQLLQTKALTNTYYWPSFEAFRWVGGHTGPVYGGHDEKPRHASREVVEMVARLFVKYFTTERIPGALPTSGSYGEVRVV